MIKRFHALYVGQVELENIGLQGDQYYWPTEPKHTLDVQAYDSPLLLPTRADVHILT